VFEERERAYKETLSKRIEPRLEQGEAVQAVAVTQVGVPPALQILPLLAGLALVIASFFVLPGWAGIAGALLLLVGVVGLSAAKRRIVGRTNRAVLVFTLPRSDLSDLEEPLARIALEELPAMRGGSVKLAGVRMWPNYGSGLERDALTEVLEAPVR
jgi:hypothetical protein